MKVFTVFTFGRCLVVRQDPLEDILFLALPSIRRFFNIIKKKSRESFLNIEKISS